MRHVYSTLDRVDRDFGTKLVESIRDFNMPRVTGHVESKGSPSEST